MPDPDTNEPIEEPSDDEPGLLGEFVDFLKSNPLWWLTPIVVMTLLLVGAAMLIPSPVAPFIYSLF